MILHTINKLKNDINATGLFVKHAINFNEFKKSNGCINFSDMSAKLFGSMIKDFDPGSIKGQIYGSIDKFLEDYKFLINDYYKIPSHLIYNGSIEKTSQKPMMFNSISEIQQNMMKLYLGDLKQSIDIISPDFTKTSIKIYSPDTINKFVRNELSKFNFDDFPKIMNELIQKMDKIQCETKKLCCV